MGRKAGLTDEKLLAAANLSQPIDLESSPFNKKERLTIELAEAMAKTPTEISDELYNRLREEFSEEQLLELSAQIAFENYRARLNRVFKVESDQLYEPGSPPS